MFKFQKPNSSAIKEPFSEEDIYNKDLCVKTNSVIAGNCVLKCGGDSSCESDCIRDFRSRNEDCPCEVFKYRQYNNLVLKFFSDDIFSE